MTSKKRFRNKYRLQLREKDHEPMHVHLIKEWKSWQR